MGVWARRCIAFEGMELVPRIDKGSSVACDGRGVLLRAWTMCTIPFLRDTRLYDRI
jgi:hypothetical protein